MHIGLIGGIGPAATIAYYKKMLQVFGAAGTPLDLTIAHADVAALIANAGADNQRAQADLFATHLGQLYGAGCHIAAITSLTGHFCFSELSARTPLPLISAITPIDDYCVAHGIGAIGLLGSPPVLQSHLYGQLQKVRTIVPAEGLETVGACYLKIATTGICTDVSRGLFFEAGGRMIGEQGAEAVLLAGTDLGLAFDGHDPGFPVIDALAIHVEALYAATRSGDRNL